MKRLLLLSGLSLLSLQGFSQAMYLDSTFSTDGLVYDLFNQHSWGTDVAVQADGKVLGTIQRDDMFRVYRLNLDGSWDTSFDGDGMFEFDAATFGAEECNAVLTQPDGKILVLGTASPLNAGMDVVLMRLNEDGSFDNTFNLAGVNMVNAGGTLNDYGRNMVLRPNGKILVTGIGGAGQSSDKLLLMQFKADGTLDSTFGTNGIILDSYQSSMTGGHHVYLQPDGKAVVCGNVFVNNNSQIIVARYDSLGVLDNTFDADGWVLLDHGAAGSEAGVRALVQTTGKIVVCSRTTDKLYRMFFNRYNADGSVDNTFGTSGATYYDFSSSPSNSSLMYEAILMPNDDILASGAVFEGGGEFNYGILRLSGSDGAVQTGWANNGTIITDFLGYYDFIYGMAIAPDGKLVAAGSSRIDGTTTLSYPSVARYKMMATSIVEVQTELKVGIYPNPSQGSFTVQSDKAATMNIVNTLGQVIKTVELSAKNNFTEKVEGLPQGVFYIQSKDGTVKNKIVSL